MARATCSAAAPRSDMVGDAFRISCSTVVSTSYLYLVAIAIHKGGCAHRVEGLEELRRPGRAAPLSRSSTVPQPFLNYVAGYS